MLENKNKKVKEIDKLILTELKGGLEIKKDKVSILDDSEMEEILKRIKEKKSMIFLLFQGDFSINERNIEEKMNARGKADLSFYDKIANTIILKKLDAAIQGIESLGPRDGRLISVCLDRKLFIQRVLQENIPLEFVKKYIQREEIEI